MGDASNADMSTSPFPHLTIKRTRADSNLLPMEADS
jgi:hypothetical protein